ncbi:MAG: hypothetical protein GY804_15195 [Alphaproteobacteria bacterium]|nr:hypothetical protein [Alphaproteobacteria bacterium]
MASKFNNFISNNKGKIAGFTAMTGLIIAEPIKRVLDAQIIDQSLIKALIISGVCITAGILALRRSNREDSALTNIKNENKKRRNAPRTYKGIPIISPDGRIPRYR